MATGTIKKIKGFNESSRLNGSSVNLDNLIGPEYNGVYYVGSSVQNAPENYGVLLHLTAANEDGSTIFSSFQLYLRQSRIYWRQRTGTPATWRTWRYVDGTELT